MTSTFHGTHGVVTGGGGGLGAAIATAFAREGASLTLMGRTPATLEAHAKTLRASFGVQVAAVTCDVTDPASVAGAFDTAVREIGPVRVLVNNAGHAVAGLVQDATLADWQRVLDVNLTGTFLCIQRVLPAMLEAGDGRIINIASTAGLKGYTRVAAYCAAKHGVVGLTRAVAAETARTGVTVNAVCPDYVEGTAMLRSAIANVARATGKSEAAARAMLASRPNGTFITMDEVAARVLWLCSIDASATTGQALLVGDETARGQA